jgi:tripeptidyl-peptidase-1
MRKLFSLISASSGFSSQIGLPLPHHYLYDSSLLIMRSTTVLGALGSAGLGLGGIILEQNVDIPQGWRQMDETLDPEQPLRLSFALRQPNIHGLYTSLAARSQNGNTHLTQQQARSLRTPDQNDVDAVMKWLEANGISGAETKDDWIHIRTTVAQAEPLLDMTLQRYEYENTGPVIRAREYSVPENLSDAISFVHPVSNFLAPKKELTAPSEERLLEERAATGVCTRGTTPKCIRELYKMPAIGPDAASDIRFGVAGFLEQYVNYADIEQFLKLTAPEVVNAGYNFSVELVNGGENPQDPAKAGSEAALDIEYAMALGYPTNITYYSTGGRGVKLDDTGKPYDEEYVDNEPYLELLEALLDKSDNEVPHVLSISYADDELSVPQPYAERVCNLLGVLTARGTSILSGSGDGGARGARNSSCRSPDGRDVTMAVFPATCPWVTGVGAVSNNGSPPNGAGFSGGGFSQYFSRPAWQDEVVEGYVKKLDGQLQKYYDSQMRATPDISAVGTNFPVMVGLQIVSLEGTSASTPLLGAMIALANDARAKAGKSALGWLNELLYSSEVRAALLDVTEGSSKPCVFGDGQSGGWPAAEGWDAITGLGVPREFQPFVDALIAY